ncbi:MAG: hypothetical protein FWE76_02445 [Symbiobacteriaceae bacterium]|nr:hypothetical protein [Symbiobacteriaceae bacterium]
MKKTTNRFASLLLCALLLLSSTGSTAFATWDAFKNLSEDEDVKITIKQTLVKEPPYRIYAEYKRTIDNFSKVADSITTWTIILQGEKISIDNQVEGEWNFTLTYEYFDSYIYHDIHTMVQPTLHQVGVTMKGTSTVTDSNGRVPEYSFTDSPSARWQQERDQKVAKNAKAIEEIRNLLAMTPEQRRGKIAEEKEKAQQTPERKTAYQAYFDLSGTGVITHNQNLTLLDPNTGEKWSNVSMGHFGSWHGAQIDASVWIHIDDQDVVRAGVLFDRNGDTLRNTLGYDLTGLLTYGKHIDAKWNITKKIPIWGTWTDKDVYAEVPKVLKDHTKCQTQLAAKAKDPSAKVDELLYNNGKWLTLVENKNLTSPLDPKYAYQMLEIADDYILMENGDIWVGADFGMHPTEKYYFPRDHQDNMALYALPLEEYESPLIESYLRVSYNPITDTLRPQLGFFMGTTLYRVTGAPFCETWTNVEGVEKPDPKTVRDKTGIWHKFELASGVYQEGKDKEGKEIKVFEPSPVGGLVFEKTTVNQNGSAEVLSGKAEVDAFFDCVVCYVEKRVTYDSSGVSTTATYGDEDEEDYDYKTLDVYFTDYDKSTETIRFNGDKFYKASKAALNGTWSTQEAAPPLPDASKEDAREGIKTSYKAPVTWLKFNSPSLEFSRLIWKPEEGLLLETGTYKNLSDTNVFLENIVGTFYDINGELVFEDMPRDGGNEMLVYYEDEGSSSIMYVNSVGRMHKTPR